MIQSTQVTHDGLVPYEIKIYSLKKNSRKRAKLNFEIQMLFFNFYYSQSYCRGKGVQASNNLHFLLPRNEGVNAFNTILRFDLTSEEFGVLGFPEELYTEDDIEIGVLDGCLCLMTIHEFSHVDVSIMKVYDDVNGSWSKLLKVMKPESVESLESVRPLVYSNDKSEVLLEINNAKNLVWFDLASKKCRPLKIKDCDSPYSVELLVSSLVLGCNGDPAQVKRREEERKRNKRDFLSKGFKLKL